MCFAKGVPALFHDSRPGWGLIVFVVVAVAGCSGAAERTLVLENGRHAYQGTADTFIQANDWDTPPQHTMNYGRNEHLFLDRDGGSNVLLRFDLSALSRGTAVISATLELYDLSTGVSQELPRRIQLFRVLTGWDEGNQVAAQVSSTPGAHGATGDDAFAYESGSGTDVPWASRGMQAGVDYDATVLAHADVQGEGWVSWDVSNVVRAWVRGDLPNDGFVLRDATGWQEGNTDWRTFASSQSPDVAHRPRLRIVYDPDAPFADAGANIEMLHFKGTPITLDASGSHDHEGGDDASLSYSWRIVTAAYGSSLSGEIGTTPVCTFDPDVPGEWKLELTVTNAHGVSASDTMAVRLLSIPEGHPRLFLTPAKLGELRTRVNAVNPRWTALKAQADAPDGAILAKALVAQVLNDPSYCSNTRGAIPGALDQIRGTERWSIQAGDIALVYDWCYDELSSAERAAILEYFSGVTSDQDDIPGWGNQWPRWGYSYAMMGLASLGDAPDAKLWMDEYRHRRFQRYDVGNLDRIAAGGGWPEGPVYDWIANLWRVKAVAGWTSATGERLFESTSWFRQRLAYLPMLQLPGTEDSWGHLFHPYLSHGDAERHRGPMTDYGRIMGLMLIGAFPSAPEAHALQGYLSAPPVDHPDSFLAYEEFLFYNPGEPATVPPSTGHFASGTGDIFLRSGWPSGAADTSSNVTIIQFHCGDRFSYHQHYEEGSFTLFSGEPLLLDSGVYSGEGLSYHDVNYYVRTIAHNTLIVYNPDEDLSEARPDAVSNDGGQRTPYPFTRAPESVAYLDAHTRTYETGDILRYENQPGYAAVWGDATAAYNTPSYNQAVHSDLSGNRAKVTHFQRELVYLRATGGRPAEAVILYDRVGVTDPAFSGEATKLLFHMQNEPTVDGPSTPVAPGETLFTAPKSASCTAAGGATATLRFVLPPLRHVRRVGGRGVKAYWVFDGNYDWHWGSDEPQPRPTNDFENVPWGEWRIELEPADRMLDHRFLTVIFPDRNGTGRVPDTSPIAADGMEGVFITHPTFPEVVLFSSADDGTPPAGTIHYALPLAHATIHHMILDLPPGSSWRLSKSTIQTTTAITLTPTPAGSLHVSRGGVLTFSTVSSPEPAHSIHRGRGRLSPLSERPSQAQPPAFQHPGHR